MRVRLRGERLKSLIQTVYERDRGLCVVCGRYVPEGVKSHHEPPKSIGGQDIEENLVTLCNDCHYQRHHGNVTRIKEKIEKYLGGMYGKTDGIKTRI